MLFGAVHKLMSEVIPKPEGMPIGTLADKLWHIELVFQTNQMLKVLHKRVGIACKGMAEKEYHVSWEIDASIQVNIEDVCKSKCNSAFLRVTDLQFHPNVTSEYKHSILTKLGGGNLINSNANLTTQIRENKKAVSFGYYYKNSSWQLIDIYSIMTNEIASIGIDLGMTYSRVGTWKNNAVEIIPNNMGERTTPSCVSFSDTERLVGTAARYGYARNSENTVFDAKRLIGRKLSEEKRSYERTIFF
ncbi:heat shock protein 70 [Reticulomyxa filosa]|uniref:Heat shock protein 70 n=1 Tax=Reticulomyxa filosa TaxID=46433 RepID=X6P099_RETFI|nr:heat shock protein 70 [Reticulomyxa filosa]|eukprot:ETO31499.1 heat shock protein 70 [Reticulomyxa filosa]